MNPFSPDWALKMSPKYRIRRWAFIIILAIAYIGAESVQL